MLIPVLSVEKQDAAIDDGKLQPIAVKQMMARYRRGNQPTKRKKFQLAVVIHAVDRETAIAELENQLVLFRENRVGAGGGSGYDFSMAYAIVDGEPG